MLTQRFFDPLLTLANAKPIQGTAGQTGIGTLAPIQDGVFAWLFEMFFQFLWQTNELTLVRAGP